MNKADTIRPAIRHGGLMRCCLLTFHEASQHEDFGSRKELKCAYCDEWMRKADDGVWEWKRHEQS